MTYGETDLKKMIEEADAKGKALEELEARNRRRRAKGRPPLPTPLEKATENIFRKRYRTGDATTVAAEDAMKLFEIRKAEMGGEVDDDEEEEAGANENDGVRSFVPIVDKHPENNPSPSKNRKKAAPKEKDEEEAVREAAAARRVDDIKAGRIDHEGNWSEDGQSIERGDETRLVDASEVMKARKTWGLEVQEEGANGSIGPQEQVKDVPLGSDGTNTSSAVPAIDSPSDAPALQERIEAFKTDLYKRLGTSFEAIERTLSELQGRVSEIVLASSPRPPESDMASEFEELLSARTPVVFDVGGTQMDFDAITVFYVPPCITLVSKIGSAKITPKPGARLRLTFESEGKKFEGEPVTFLGTRFDLPMFGLSFVGFIRDADADRLDSAAGIESDDQGE